MSLENGFDVAFTAALALREKQIQQNYRPIIGVHKWFARRPGTVFRSLLLAEFVPDEPTAEAYWHSHGLKGVIADPFMGGGTPVYEATRLGFSVVAADVNPMAYWVVRQALAPLDLDAFGEAARSLVGEVEREIGDLYSTECLGCGGDAAVKYFIWVKTQACPECNVENDLFPGYLLAEATRHPRHVVACAQCGELNEFDVQPTKAKPAKCTACHAVVHVEGPAKRNRIQCRSCASTFAYPTKPPASPPVHRMWAIEFHCDQCKPTKQGRFFKKPTAKDLATFDAASRRLGAEADSLTIPDEGIPAGDETDRLHRWGYRRYREMFNARQLLSLGLLFSRIVDMKDSEVRRALLTVFSDFLRYQNMLCRYDTYALKCQDIFSVHGFPVGLVQCENNVLGIPGVGSGAFRHFVEKYLKAKRYAEAPFETRFSNGRKQLVAIDGERIASQLTDRFPHPARHEAYLAAMPAEEMSLRPSSLDGVFTDPPYFDNVQYAELMDFCFVWLRLGLKENIPQFERRTTRTDAELTGNDNMGRGIEHFTAGLSKVFTRYAAALKADAPFVFTYHHNSPVAYMPLVVAILDAGMDCTTTLPAPAEMGASLHISGTASSVVDTIFVCRVQPGGRASGRSRSSIAARVRDDARRLAEGGVKVTLGDLRCLVAGHVARLAINSLRGEWTASIPILERMRLATFTLERFAAPVDTDAIHHGIRGADADVNYADSMVHAPL